MKLNESTITLRAGTAIVLLSILVAVISSAATYAFTYGYNKRDREAQDDIDANLQKQIDEIKADYKTYTDLEVGGLRSDWERQYKIQDKRLENLESRIVRR